MNSPKFIREGENFTHKFIVLLTCVLVFQIIFLPITHAATTDPERTYDVPRESPRVSDRVEDQALVEISSQEILRFQKLFFKVLRLEAVGHPLDTYRLFDQMATRVDSPQKIHPDKVVLQVIRGETVVQQIRPGAEGFQRTASQTQRDEEFKFQIVYQGEVLHRFRMPIHNLYFEAKKIYFQEPETPGVSFIDLKAYGMLLGVTALPVFNLQSPTLNKTRSELHLNEAILEKRGEDLLYGSDVLSSKSMDLYSGFWQVLWNATINLITSVDFEKDAIGQMQVLALTENLVTAAEQIAERGSASEEEQAGNAAGYLRDLPLLAERKVDELKVRHGMAGGLLKHLPRNVLELEADVLQKEAHFQNAMLWHTKDVKAQKKFGARVKRLWHRLSIPQPYGALKLQTAMTAAAVAQDPKEAVLQLANNKYVQLGSAVVAGVALGLAQPEALSHFAYQTLHFTKFMAGGFAIMAWRAAKTFLRGVTTFPKRYEDKGIYLLEGVAAVSALMLAPAVIAHLAVNVTHLIKDLRAKYGEDLGTALSERGFRDLLIERENQRQPWYEELLAAKVRSEMNIAPQEFTPEQDEQARKIRADFESPIRNSMIGRFLGALRRLRGFDKLAAAPSGEICTFGAALRHFLIGAPSLYMTVDFTSGPYQAYTAFRHLLLHPIVFSASVMFPRFFWSGVLKEAQLPSELNGVMRPFWRSPRLKEAVRLLREGVDTEHEDWEHGKADWMKRTKEMMSLASPGAVLAQEKWEDRLLEGEALISRAAAGLSIRALTREIEDPVLVQKFYAAGTAKGTMDQRLKQVPYALRVFFMAYQNELIERARNEWLRRLASEIPDVDVDAATPDELKNLTLGFADRMGLTPGVAKELVDAVNGAEVVQVARARGQNAWNAKSVEMELQRRIVGHLQNSYVPRQIAIVARQRTKPTAVLRATDDYLSTVLTDNAVTMMWSFIGFAGMEDGFLPIYNEAFSDESFAHVNKMIFIYGPLWRAMLNPFSQPWGKLFRDSWRPGQLERPANPEIRSNSYIRFYTQNILDAPISNLHANMMRRWETNTRMMGLYIASDSIRGLAVLGRIDVDVIVSEIIASNLLPVEAFHTMRERVFESTKEAFIRRGIPLELLAHPEVLMMMDEMRRKLRVKYDLADSPVYNSVDIWRQILLLQSSPSGDRGFVRQFMPGGERSAQLLVDGLKYVGVHVPLAPVKAATELCADLFSNNDPYIRR